MVKIKKELYEKALENRKELVKKYYSDIVSEVYDAVDKGKLEFTFEYKMDDVFHMIDDIVDYIIKDTDLDVVNLTTKRNPYIKDEMGQLLIKWSNPEDGDKITIEL